MEYSPPGIHAIPSGVLPGAGVVFGTVTAKFFVGGTAVEAATIGLAFGECVVDDFQAAKPPSNTTMPTATAKGVRFGGTTCSDLMVRSFLVIGTSVCKNAQQILSSIEGSRILSDVTEVTAFTIPD